MDLKNISKEQAKDTGLALVLVLLIIEYIMRPGWLVVVAMAVLVLTMVRPAILKPFAKLWFGFSHFLGTIFSKVILSLIFFLIVTPVGFIRRMYGANPMKKGQWKKGGGSVLQDRNHRYTLKDLEKPY